MTNTQKLTNEQMTENLYSLAEEIFLLCAILTRRKLAHAFCTLFAHVEQLESKVMPYNSNYNTEAGVTPSAANIKLYLDMKDSISTEDNEHKYQESVKEMEIYISYLDLLIAKNETVLCPQEQAA